jgi:hypothetical protein
MQSKKTVKKSNKKAAVISRSKSTKRAARVRVLKPEEVSRVLKEVNKDSLKDGDDFGPYPIRRNPERAEEGEKRLAARKALTLKAFRIAYENYHRRNGS